MLGYAMGFDGHVVDVDLDISSDLLFENPIHQSLVCNACIFKAKGHNLVAKFGIFSDECPFLLVLSVHSRSNCIRSRSPGSLVLGTWTLHRLVYLARPVQISVSVSLFDHYDIGELGIVLEFSNKVGFEELVDSLSDSFVSFFSHFPFLL